MKEVIYKVGGVAVGLGYAIGAMAANALLWGLITAPLYYLVGYYVLKHVYGVAL